MALAHIRFTINSYWIRIMKRLCLGRLIIDHHLFTMHPNEAMLVHRASPFSPPSSAPPQAEEGELAHSAPAEPANSEISIIYWCLTNILVLLFAQVFRTHIVWKIQLFLSVSWCPAKPNSIDWNMACWCFCEAKEVDGNLPPLCWMV